MRTVLGAALAISMLNGAVMAQPYGPSTADQNVVPIQGAHQ